jgi:hypothetical protein
MAVQEELDLEYISNSLLLEYHRRLTEHDAKRRVIFSQTDCPDLPFALRLRVFNYDSEEEDEDAFVDADDVHPYVDIERPIIVKWNDRILRSVAYIDDQGHYSREYYEYPAIHINLHRAADYLSRARNRERGTISVSFELDTLPPLSLPPTDYTVQFFYLNRFHPLSLVESSLKNAAIYLDYNANNVLELYAAGSLPKSLVRRINDHIGRYNPNIRLRCRFLCGRLY